MTQENQISKVIVDAAVEVHRVLGGPGLLEDVYEEALVEELRQRGLLVERQLPVRIVYKGRVLRKPLRLDMKVERLVLVDNKAVIDWNAIKSIDLIPLRGAKGEDEPICGRLAGAQVVVFPALRKQRT